MKRICAGITAGLMLAATAWVGGTGAAMADYGSDRNALCGTGTNNCSITIRDAEWTLVEGRDKATVDVTGSPNVTVSLQMYSLKRYEYNPDYFDTIRSYGPVVPVITNGSGKASVKVPIAVLTAPDGGFTSVAFQLAGSTVQSTNEHPIEALGGGGIDTTFVQSARGSDVTESRTITDGQLPSWVRGGITGDVYGVQVKVNGKWQDVTDIGRPGNGMVGTDGGAKAWGNVGGLPDGEYLMRMFNRTRGIYDLPDMGFSQHALTLAKNIYITPGEHMKNGRKWRTTCEPYSATERCRTEIWATTVEFRNGKIAKRTGWFFNNLTYKESPRTLWKNNPLGKTGSWSVDGRKWRTECDSPKTGGNGCRSYIVTTVVEATKSGNGYIYKAVTKEVFNNIVMFTSTQ